MKVSNKEQSVPLLENLKNVFVLGTAYKIKRPRRSCLLEHHNIRSAILLKTTMKWTLSAAVACLLVAQPATANVDAYLKECTKKAPALFNTWVKPAYRKRAAISSLSVLSNQAEEPRKDPSSDLLAMSAGVLS
jgi:hypothetical protein